MCGRSGAEDGDAHLVAPADVPAHGVHDPLEVVATPAPSTPGPRRCRWSAPPARPAAGHRSRARRSCCSVIGSSGRVRCPPSIHAAAARGWPTCDDGRMPAASPQAVGGGAAGLLRVGGQRSALARRGRRCGRASRCSTRAPHHLDLALLTPARADPGARRAAGPRAGRHPRGRRRGIRLWPTRAGPVTAGSARSTSRCPSRSATWPTWGPFYAQARIAPLLARGRDRGVLDAGGRRGARPARRTGRRRRLRHRGAAGPPAR